MNFDAIGMIAFWLAIVGTPVFLLITREAAWRDKRLAVLKWMPLPFCVTPVLAVLFACMSGQTGSLGMGLMAGLTSTALALFLAAAEVGKRR